MVAGTETPRTPASGPHWRLETVVPWCGALVSGLGLLALVGWLARLPLLTGFGSGTVPMAPSTAALFVAHGVLLVLRARPVLDRRATLASAVVGGTSGVVALTLLVLWWRGIRTPLEHLGMDITGATQGTPQGHMSPITAACFLLASLSSLTSLHAASRRSRAVALGSAGLLLGTGVLFLLAYLYGRPLLYGDGFIPPAINTTLAMATLGLGLLAVGGRRGAHSERLPQWTRASGSVLLVFLLLSVGLVAAGYFLNQSHERSYRAEVEGELLTVAEWKVSELTQWRHERIGDATVLLGNESFADLVERRVERPDDEPSGELWTWLRQVRESYRYERVFLVDPGGVVLASVPESNQPVAPHLLPALGEALRRREVTFLDFHRDAPDGAIHLSMLVPIYAPRASDRRLGVLVLRINPYQDLYPMLQRWPTPSQTAETLLVRRDGDDVLFLNELRFRTGTALSLRASLTNDRLPAAKAALGNEGIFEGVDYRGVDVISALRSVPGSPWALVARMDTAEVYAPLSERLWLTVVLVVTLLLGSGATLGLLWRQQGLRLYREQYESAEALRASENELKQRNEELTRFTYSVSHDLKSPLVTIQTFVGYLEQDLSKQDPAAVQKDFGFIRGAAQKMSRLLDELLELSRVGRTKNPAEDVTLQALVDEALTLVAGRVAERGVRVDVTTEPVILHGDRVRLVEVFQNLLDNAVKFMGEQPSPRVEIGVRTAGADLELVVRDNGVGIDPRHMGKLFGLFEKLDPRSEGTGIGLALVRRIVEAHGGRIRVESEGPGQGARFCFTLAGTKRAPSKDAP